jgi:hypothetical protein
MPVDLQLLLNGSAVSDDVFTAMVKLEVEENLDLPDAIQLVLNVSADDDGEPLFVSDPQFGPFANIAVVVTPDGGSAQCIFDGYLLSHHLHLETGTTASRLEAWGQDASWLMNLEEKIQEWVSVTDADAADSIFSDYGISPFSSNHDDDSPSHDDTGHSLMQRGTDIQFLRHLARRSGKLCRVACTDSPGQRTGYFCRPDLTGDAVAVLKLNGAEDERNVVALDLHWDATAPTEVKAAQSTFDDPDEDGATVDVSDSGLTPIDERGLADFTTKTMSVLMTTTVDDEDELSFRAEGLLVNAGWFARCEGETDAARLGVVLRAGDIVQFDGLGALNSGKYLVWSVRHTITVESHRMRFTVVRNAVGPDAQGAAASIESAVGALG